MLYVIDRFEDNWAIIDHNRETFNLPLDLLPADAKEGDIININITVDKNMTKKAQNDVKSLMESLFEK